MGTKTCAECQITKSTADFYADKSRPDGFQRICKSCNRDKNAARYAANKEAEKARARAYRAENLERLSAYDKAKYAAKKEIYKDRNLAYRERHPERMSAYKKRWNDINRDRYRAVKLKNEGARRARKAATSAHIFTTAQMQSRIDYYGGKCWICRTEPYAALDHVKPLSRGGMHILANLRPACQPCNSSKGAKWPFVPPAPAAF